MQILCQRYNWIYSCPSNCAQRWVAGLFLGSSVRTRTRDFHTNWHFRSLISKRCGLDKHLCWVRSPRLCSCSDNLWHSKNAEKRFLTFGKIRKQRWGKLISLPTQGVRAVTKGNWLPGNQLSNPEFKSKTSKEVKLPHPLMVFSKSGCALYSRQAGSINAIVVQLIWSLIL